jgi:hypothetical protein
VLPIEHSRIGRNPARSHVNVACAERVSDPSNAERSRSLFSERMTGFVAGTRKPAMYVRSGRILQCVDYVCKSHVRARVAPVRTLANTVPRVSCIVVRCACLATTTTSSSGPVLPDEQSRTTHLTLSTVRTVCNVIESRAVAF